jgi:hypothetical protein
MMSVRAIFLPAFPGGEISASLLLSQQEAAVRQSKTDALIYNKCRKTRFTGANLRFFHQISTLNALLFRFFKKIYVIL